MPKVVDHELRRAEIVAAATEVIAASGIEGATMRAIAERAGCTTGRLTHYFSGRNEILTAALRRAHANAGHRMAAAARTRTGAAALRAVLLEALPLDAPRQQEWRVWLAFWGQAVTDRELRAENARRYAEWRRMLGTLIGQAAPGVAVPERRARVEELVALVDGIGLQATLAADGSAGRRAPAIRAMVDCAVARAVA